MRIFSGTMLLFLHSPSAAEAWDGTALTNFVTADISGWQLQCDLKIRSYEDPSKCFALFNLPDGNVILDYRAEGLRIQTIGKCGNGAKPLAPMALPVTELATAIERAARRPDLSCKPPILTAKMYLGLRALNTIATILTQKRP